MRINDFRQPRPLALKDGKCILVHHYNQTGERKTFNTASYKIEWKK